VDSIRPQKFGPYGCDYYSFLEREHLLNLILRFFDNKQRLPIDEELLELISVSRCREYYRRDEDTLPNRPARRSTTIDDDQPSGHFWLFTALWTLFCILKLAVWLGHEAPKQQHTENTFTSKSIRGWAPDFIADGRLSDRLPDAFDRSDSRFRATDGLGHCLVIDCRRPPGRALPE
jgi:hypothetical protein